MGLGARELIKCMIGMLDVLLTYLGGFGGSVVDGYLTTLIEQDPNPGGGKARIPATGKMVKNNF